MRDADDATPIASVSESVGQPHPSSRPAVVGIGASAGGLTALRSFFSQVPASNGVAWVVIIHLSPEHPSHLADLLQPHVRMPVQQVTQTVPLEADHVYIIPPGANLNAVDTHLRLTELEQKRRQRAPIDHFFRTLSETHDGHSIGVILTGTGSDGSLGVRAIKEKNGLTVVQDPAEAEYDGMPQSAISTGMVDLVLPLDRIPEAVLRFARTEPRLPLVDEEELEAEQRRLLLKVFGQIRARTGRDFTQYKRSTILRRIQRRMQIRQIEELADYQERLREEPDEVRALADDLLITVTNFFRDREIFEQLETEIVPALFQGKGPQDSVRVWSVGCATGEEAYSLAMLLLEEASRREEAPRLQVFASDLHERSLERAREGFYPGDIETDVSEQRLRRFFHQENGGYRIRKEVRELVVFAPHNLLGDPPFSRIDLIACRNVLIYLQRKPQGDVMELFHYALRPDGYLVLGTSETIEGSELFRPVKQIPCTYRKRNVSPSEPRLPAFAVPPVRIPAEEVPSQHPRESVSYGTLHQRMVEQYAPPSMLVSPDHKIVHLSEHAGRYLVHPGGEMTSNVFKLVREELRVELRAALHAAHANHRPSRSKPIPVGLDGDRRSVVLDVRPAAAADQQGFFLVIFDERGDAEPEPEGTTARTSTGEGSRVAELEAELALSEQRLQVIIEEYETGQEEMRASHEELQSANEELRSTLEELETSKEELQSMNEELQTVNQENRHKVEELAQMASDLQNLLAATDIATLFLDRELRILRFTPQVAELFNVRPVDRGRPLSDLTHRLGYSQMQSDAEAVLRRLMPIEREVQDEHGRWYLTRVLPYRSTSDRIEGVVITLIEITGRKEAEKGLREAKDAAEQASEAKSQFLAVMSHELRTPLTGVIGFAELLEKEVLGPMAEKQREALARIKSCSWHLVTIIDEILTFSRVEAGKEELHEADVDLVKIAREVVEVVEAQADAHGLTLQLEHGDGAVVVRTDPGKVRQILLNLVGNAVRYTERGSIAVELDRSEPEWLHVRVRDTGPGIAARDQERIFEPFTQLDSSLTRTGGGTGLGLAICRRLGRLVDGEVTVSSTVGQGSVFSLRLPNRPGGSDLDALRAAPRQR